MSQSGIVIDGLEFASRHETASGRLSFSVLPRLQELLAEGSGGIDFEVSGDFSEGRAFLAVKLEGRLPLVCQRCLETVPFDLNLRSRMLLVMPGEHWPEDGQPGGLDDESCDAIEASHELELIPLLEEEILLALPIAPRHETCRLPGTNRLTREPSPFARLAGLRRN